MVSHLDFRALFETMASPCLVLDRDLRCVAVNTAYAAAAGRRREDLLGRHVHQCFPRGTEGGERLHASLTRVIETGRAEAIDAVAFDFARPGAPSDLRFWSLVHTPMTDADGQVTFVTQSAVDVTGTLQIEQQQKLLIAELNHRVKNALATVQSIALQTRRTTADVEDFQRAFEARLTALAATHDLLTDSAWRGARLRDVIEREITPYGAGRYELDGPPVDLSPPQALALGMMFHELTTNAVKHGALSAADGKVRASWRVEPPDGRLHILWAERGGPTVRPPSRRGFGSRLIARALKEEASGEASLEFDPAGLVCRMDLPLGDAAPG